MTKTANEVVEAALRHIGILDALESASAADRSYVLSRYRTILAELEDEDLAYWDEDAIPLQVFEPLSRLVALEIASAYGKAPPVADVDGLRDGYLRRIRSHSHKNYTEAATTVEDF